MPRRYDAARPAPSPPSAGRPAKALPRARVVVHDADVSASPVSWIDRLERDGAPRGPAVPEAVLVGYPVALGVRYREHLAEVFRELQMVATSTGDGAGAAPGRLVALAHEVVEAFGDLLSGPHADTERAAATGVAQVDLRYPLDGRSRGLAMQFARVMEKVDDYSRTEDLVTLQAPDDLYALRRWSVEEYVRQYDGLPPRPWPPWWAEYGDAYAPGAAARGDERGDPEGPGRPAGAPT
jgi:hypothetical protein